MILRLLGEELEEASWLIRAWSRMDPRLAKFPYMQPLWSILLLYSIGCLA